MKWLFLVLASIAWTVFAQDEGYEEAPPEENIVAQPGVDEMPMDEESSPPEPLEEDMSGEEG